MQTNRQYETVARAIRWMADHRTEQPELETLAAAMCVSPHHLQRTFQTWAGVSPKQFLKSLTRASARARLLAGDTVQDAAFNTGLSGPGRLHDLMISTEALTPGEIRRRGRGVQLDYGYGDCPFGQALVGWTDRGIHFLGFCDEPGATTVFEQLRGQWANAVLREDSRAAQRWIDRIFNGSGEQPLSLWLRGSPFQLKVWEALLAIPEGAHSTYGRLAAAIGQPGAARAVGGAVGSNPLAWIIPCHRVIRQAGEIGGYRWGVCTKRAMIGYEAARRRRADPGSGTRQIDD
jgi:AraC family transcriptional regulator of adaptative response/methylated-DNA-[protein]-cysteine methyltransferase